MKRFEKKILLLLIFIGVVLLSACSDKDEPKIHIPTNMNLSVGSLFSVGVSGNWISSNEFVASVDKDGVIKAEHVGMCIISGEGKQCRVIVEPKSNFLNEPIIEWGISKSQLISKCGNDYKESGSAIGYITNSTIAPITMYTFDNNGKLSSSAIVVKTNYSTELVDFLTERYQPIGMDGYDFYFTNGYTPQKTSTVVGMSLYKYDKNYWVVLYMPYSYSSRSSVSTDISNSLLDIIEK